MPDDAPPALSRRERQLPTSSTGFDRSRHRRRDPRAAAGLAQRLQRPHALRLSADKGHSTHEVDGLGLRLPRHDLARGRRPHGPAPPGRHLFGGSADRPVSALVDDEQLDEQSLDELARLIDARRKPTP
ncbi:MAG: hypothetical protein R3F59_26960 [Myxococcota bacterium]